MTHRILQARAEAATGNAYADWGPDKKRGLPQ